MVRQCCHVGNTAQHCRLGLFQDSDFVRGVLSAKVPDSSFAEAQSVLLSEPIHMEGEDEDQENEVEDERESEECKVESRRESRRTTTQCA